METAVFTHEYLDDVLVRLAHHSSAIEGNTISLADTISIILHNTIPSKVDKREFYEIENHKGAFEFVLECAEKGEEISIGLVKGIHRKLTDRLLHDAGELKKTENAILGAKFNTASPHQTPFLMKQWCDNLGYRLENSSTKDEKIRIILESHMEFERIHPFIDGNGRTGRMLMNYSFLVQGIAPLIIEGSRRTEYINILASEDLDRFFNFACEMIREEEERMQRFSNKEKSQIKY